jgi:hypothetical protein
MATYKVLQPFQAQQYPAAPNGQINSVSYTPNSLISCHWVNYPDKQRLINTINFTDYDVTGGPLTQVTSVNAMKNVALLGGVDEKSPNKRSKTSAAMTDVNTINVEAAPNQNLNNLIPQNKMIKQFLLIDHNGDRETITDLKMALREFYRAKRDFIAELNSDEEDSLECGGVTLMVRNLNEDTLEASEWVVWADYTVPEAQDLDEDESLEDIEESVLAEEEED